MKGYSVLLSGGRGGAGVGGGGNTKQYMIQIKHGEGKETYIYIHELGILGGYGV
jgi:hypothetical protein